MGIKKNYKGYKSFQYLEAGKDYKAYTFAKEIDRVPPFLVPLSEAEEKRVNALAEKFVVISLHDHPVRFPENMAELFDYNRQGRQSTAFEGLSVSCLDAVFDNLMDGTCMITSKGGWKWEEVLFDLGMRLCDLAHQDFIIVCRKVEDILTAHKEGKLALIPTLESSTPIENELARLEILYGFGVRMMGLVYSESNVLGSGLREDRDGGLTVFGRQVVECMNKIGMAIDVSHCGDLTAMDAIEASKKPIFISHVGARALWDIKRLKTDDVFKACAAKGGLIGVEAAPHTTITRKHQEHGIDSFMEHFEYLKDLVGIDHVGFGPDTLYGDHVGLHHAFAASLSIKHVAGQHKEVPYVKGVENPTEASWNPIRWLVKHGYSDKDIEKVVGGNALRVLREVG